MNTENNFLGQFVKVIDDKKCLNEINQNCATDTSWPNQVIRNKSGRNEWRRYGYTPKNGDIGEIVAKLNCSIFDEPVYIVRTFGMFYIPLYFSAFQEYKELNLSKGNIKFKTNYVAPATNLAKLLETIKVISKENDVTYTIDEKNIGSDIQVRYTFDSLKMGIFSILLTLSSENRLNAFVIKGLNPDIKKLIAIAETNNIVLNVPIMSYMVMEMDKMLVTMFVKV